MLLLLAVAGNGTLNAQRGMRVMRDTTRIDSIRTVMNVRRMRSMDRRTDSLRMRDIRNRISPARMRDARQGMGPAVMSRMWRIQPGQMRGMRGIRQAPQFNMRRGMGRMPVYRLGRSQMGRSWSGIERMPDFTEEQKKEIADLRKQQQDEMNSLRDEMSENMRILREKHRSILLDQLTDEQKKAFESRSGRTDQPPSPVQKKK